MDRETVALIGRVVRVDQGHHAGELAVIVGQINEHLVYIADGKKRSFHRPKKKNLKHVYLYDYASDEVKNSILQTGRVSDEVIRQTIGEFRSTYLSEEEGTT